jgi:hypothetical protein
MCLPQSDIPNVIAAMSEGEFQAPSLLATITEGGYDLVILVTSVYRIGWSYLLVYLYLLMMFGSRVPHTCHSNRSIDRVILPFPIT